jgi:hypothetical protein
MRTWRFSLAAAVIAVCFAHTAAADLVCPDSSYCTVTFSKTYTGSYRTGQPYDYVTITPEGSGETFASTGITFKVYLRNCLGAPLVGVPPQDVVLFHPSLCLCPGGNIADAPTDINGCTSFSGTIAGGGCIPETSGLMVYVDGILICAPPIKVNSADAVPASPCFVDASDIAALAAVLGKQVGQAGYTICRDLNETGKIDASEVAYLASQLGDDCAP